MVPRRDERCLGRRLPNRLDRRDGRDVGEPIQTETIQRLLSRLAFPSADDSARSYALFLNRPGLVGDS